MSALLRIRALDAGYGDLPVLHGVDLDVEADEVVSIVGANSAGKTTLLSTIAGLLAPTHGTIEFAGADITALPAHRVVARGITLVPEGRRLFPLLTIEENLRLGAFHPEARRAYRTTLKEMFELFPVLADRRDQLAGSLSGGEQQMCAIARGLMARPELLMLDEPSLGLAPKITAQLFGLVRDLAERGLTVLLVEQNVGEALELSSRGYVIEQGRIVLSGASHELLGNAQLQAAYLGAA